MTTSIIGDGCSHGKRWDAECADCALVSAKEFVARWGPMVDEARAVIAASRKKSTIPPPSTTERIMGGLLEASDRCPQCGEPIKHLLHIGASTKPKPFTLPEAHNAP